MDTSLIASRVKPKSALTRWLKLILLANYGAAFIKDDWVALTYIRFHYGEEFFLPNPAARTLMKIRT
jgi:hypothetical protein